MLRLTFIVLALGVLSTAAEAQWHSIGRWDGDSLVVESNGFTERTWLDVASHPHTERLHITERYRRRDIGHMEVQLMLDDPEIYAKPWTVTVPLELVADSTLTKYAGIYEFKDDSGRPHVVEVTVSNGELFWDQDGVGRQRLLPFSDQAFSLSGWHVTFVTDSQGAVTHFLGQAAEGETKGVRRK